MAFFNVDDQFHGHPKRRKAGWAAIGLWTAAGSWCRAYKQDGFVPGDLIDEWHARKLAGQLVDAELWFETKGGYQFHDWLDIQTPSDIVEKQREKARERQRSRRKKLEELRDGA